MSQGNSTLSFPQGWHSDKGAPFPSGLLTTDTLDLGQWVAVLLTPLFFIIHSISKSSFSPFQEK